ncbi:MAG TPA: hypothetical protein PLU87_07815 [Sedimentisphaerales bacterium]|nr:hypothetical protein [Sedimentisphaerales bacterium]HRS10623.1 hypothetical protein [Sedimentisphaerales bacterium]HRV47328.1 hypothetical protein [Sedimentisphaerales bacterium]
MAADDVAELFKPAQLSLPDARNRALGGHFGSLPAKIFLSRFMTG